MNGPTVAVQGMAGCYSHLAALTALGEDWALLPCRDLAAVCAAVLRGAAERGVLPLENSLAGPVPGAADLLRASGLAILDETVLRVRHCLIARPGAELAGIRRVASHPVALAQCRRFFARHPGLTPVAAEDTAGSVRRLMERRSLQHAAIASARAAELYGARVLLEGIEDDPANATRFCVIARGP